MSKPICEYRLPGHGAKCFLEYGHGGCHRFKGVLSDIAKELPHEDEQGGKHSSPEAAMSDGPRRCEHMSLGGVLQCIWWHGHEGTHVLGPKNHPNWSAKTGDNPAAVTREADAVSALIKLEAIINRTDKALTLGNQLSEHGRLRTIAEAYGKMRFIIQGKV